MDINSSLHLFDKLWQSYIHIIDVNEQEFNFYGNNIVWKIRENNYDFLKVKNDLIKTDFIDLINLMRTCIHYFKYLEPNEYYIKYYNKNKEQDKDEEYVYEKEYNEKEYDENNSYKNDKELNLLYNLKEYLTLNLN